MGNPQGQLEQCGNSKQQLTGARHKSDSYYPSSHAYASDRAKGVQKKKKRRKEERKGELLSSACTKLLELSPSSILLVFVAPKTVGGVAWLFLATFIFL